MKATLYIPASGPIKASRHDCLSDDEAMVFGRAFARTLSDDDGYVIVTLSDGTEKVIGHDTLSGEVTVGTLRYRNGGSRFNYRTPNGWASIGPSEDADLWDQCGPYAGL